MDNTDQETDGAALDQEDVDEVADSPSDESAIESAFLHADEELHDTMKPIYEFRWDDGSVRRTDDMENEVGRIAVENLATMGREDPACSVKAVGFET